MPLPKDNLYTSDDYWNLPEGQRSELIDGELYDMAPPSRIHQRLISQLTVTISNYIRSQSGSCEVYPAPFAVNLTSNEQTWVEPDISVICDKQKLSDRGCEGAPDWIIEIVSPSSSRLDYFVKLFKYRSSGVREYWIVNPMKKTVQTYSFEGDENSVQYSFDDIIHVEIYNDLEIRINDLLP